MAIARCLAMEPEIILFDEPTSALDPTMVSEVLSIIQRLAKEGLTMAIVTHEMDFARDVSNRVFYMDEGLDYSEKTGDVELTFIATAAAGNVLEAGNHQDDLPVLLIRNFAQNIAYTVTDGLGRLGMTVRRG